MKKAWNKAAALGLTLALLAGSLAGCGETASQATQAPTPTADVTPSPTPDPSPSPSSTPDRYGEGVATADVIQLLLGVPRETEALTVNGTAVDAEEYFYWLGYFAENVAYSNYGSPEAMDWEGQINGQSVRQALKDSAREASALYSVIRSQADQRGLSITQEDREALDSYMEEIIQDRGGQEGYRNSLEQIGRSDQGLRQMLITNNYLYIYLEEALFPLPEMSQEDLQAWADENGMMQVKHILLKTIDSTGATLPQEEKAAVEEKARALLAQLQGAQDQDREALFDQLMNQLSEDGRTADGALYAPDGYFFGEGEMVEEFETAAKGLGVHEMSGLVETAYGYHILLRLPADPEMAREVWQEAAIADMDDQMGQLVQRWLDEAQVVTTPLVDDTDPKDFYEGLLAWRASLESSQG